MTDEIQTIVIDNGSCLMKAGFSGDALCDGIPRAVFPSVIGRPKLQCEQQVKDCYIGSDAYNTTSILQFKNPIERGAIADVDDMEKIWHHTFYNELHADPEEHPVLLLEHFPNCRPPREKMTQVMFETFSIPSIFLGRSTSFALYGARKSTGVVVDCGDGVTDICCFVDGFLLRGSDRQLRLGGCDITTYLQRSLNERCYDFTTARQKNIVRDIKEKLAYVATDFEAEKRKAETSNECEENYSLYPYCNDVTVSSERFTCPELLFKPYLNGLEWDGIHEVICDAVTNCDKDLWRSLYANVILCGGGARLRGLRERLEAELSDLAKTRMITARVNVVVPEHCEYAAWIGGSAFRPDYNTFWTHEQYNECGPGGVHRVFPA